MSQRKVDKIYSPAGHEGFLGTGHTAIQVVGGTGYHHSNPFIFLMDDQLDLPGGHPVGGPHPHAGIETVTLMLETDENSNFDGLKAGDMEWMTAGGGVVHGEFIHSATKLRLLQLWLVLPEQRRSIAPKLQVFTLPQIPTYQDGATLVRVYSGRSQGLQGSAENETPVTIVGFNVAPGYHITQELPASYTGFLYMLKGTLSAGSEQTLLSKQQVAWIAGADQDGPGEIQLKAGDAGARFVLYAGEPQGGEIIQQGPFVADSAETIKQLYRNFREGKMMHIHAIHSGS